MRGIKSFTQTTVFSDLMRAIHHDGELWNKFECIFSLMKPTPSGLSQWSLMMGHSHCLWYIISIILQLFSNPFTGIFRLSWNKIALFKRKSYFINRLEIKYTSLENMQMVYVWVLFFTENFQYLPRIRAEKISIFHSNQANWNW